MSSIYERALLTVVVLDPVPDPVCDMLMQRQKNPCASTVDTHPVLRKFVPDVGSSLFDLRFILQLLLVVHLVKSCGSDVEHTVDLRHEG